jgi:hypothetical protein
MLLHERIKPNVWHGLCDAAKHTVTVTLVSLLCLAAAPTAQAQAPVPGHERTLEVMQLQTGGPGVIRPPVIDGKLDDAVWEQVNASQGFWCSLQDKPPTDDTQVLVVMDDNYLYFGFRMYDTEPQTIQSTVTVRDVGLGYNDSITIQLDTFFNRRDISEFSINPGGTQSDDIAGGRSGKIEWKGDWKGAATRTGFGWTAEFAIPFAMLNYQDGDTVFGVNFKRYQSRTREYSYWADTTPQGLEEEMGQLTGLVLPSHKQKTPWTFMPFVLAGKNIPDEKGDIQDSRLTAGMNVRYQPRPDLTAMFALNPDYSQIEEAVTNISFSYTEKPRADNRPFFAEGLSYFDPSDDDLQYFYSKRIVDFDLGAKSFGRMNRIQFGSFILKGPEQRCDFAARTLYEVDETNSAVAYVVGTSQTDFNNTLALAQFTGRQPFGLNYKLDAAITNTSMVTDPEVPAGNGSHLEGSLGWKWDHVSVNGGADYYDSDYFPANALLKDDLPGTQGASLTSGYYREMSGPAWRVVDGYVGVNYRETDTGELQRRKVFASGSVEFHNDIRVQLYADVGPYRPVTDVRGVFGSTINNDRLYSVATSFNTRSSRHSYGLQYDWGNLGGGPYNYYAAYGWWRPLNPVYLSATAERTDSFGIYDQVVLVGSWDITPEHALACRFIQEETQFYRLAYVHHPRKGLDIYAVYDDAAGKDAEYSIKLVKTF